MSTVCPRCGAAFSPDASTGSCPVCGTALPAPAPAPAPVLATAVAPTPLPFEAARCAVHPDAPAAIACARCGSFACAACRIVADGAEVCAACGSRAAAPYVPWEHRQELGIFRAYWRTSRGLLLEPSRAWPRVPASGSFWDATSFLILSGYVQWFGYYLVYAGAMFVGLLAAAAESTNSEGWIAAIAVPVVMVVVYLVFTPVQVMMDAFLRGGLEHLTLVLMKQSRGFDATYRSFCYGQAAALLGVIPVCGTMTAPFVQMVTRGYGYVHLHRTTPGRAAVAIIAPMVVCGVIVVAAYAALIAAVLAAGAASGD